MDSTVVSGSRFRLRWMCKALLCVGGGLALAAALGLGVGTPGGLALAAVALLAPAARLAVSLNAEGPRFRVPFTDSVLLAAAVALGSPTAAVPGALAGAGALIFGQTEAVSLPKAIGTILKPAALSACAAMAFQLAGGSTSNLAGSILPAVAAAAALAALRWLLTSREDAPGAARVAARAAATLALAYPTAVCVRAVPASLVISVAAVVALHLVLRDRPREVEATQALAPPAQPARAAEEISLVDPLTGLANRRYLTMFLTQEISRSQRSRQPLSVLLLDLDELDKVNASSGREAGDAALQQVARHLKYLVRDYDVVARYAGDEFVIILPETAAQEAAEIAGRIHQYIVKQPDAKTTVTVGVATYPDHGASSEDLLSSAHHALNRAKFGGKNSVCSCHTLARAS